MGLMLIQINSHGMFAFKIFHILQSFHIQAKNNTDKGKIDLGQTTGKLYNFVTRTRTKILISKVTWTAQAGQLI